MIDMEKVTAYITREQNGQMQMLVFLEEGYEHLGLQVPGGTVIEGEESEASLLREISEEAGLTQVRCVRDLGECDYFWEKKGHNVRRYYYHVALEEECADTFTYVVKSDDEDNGWVYNYFWIDLEPNKKPQLFGWLGHGLDALITQLFTADRNRVV